MYDNLIFDVYNPDEQNFLSGSQDYHNIPAEPPENFETTSSELSELSSQNNISYENFTSYDLHHLSPGLQFFYVVAFGLMILVSIGGNLIVVWIVLAHKRMRTVTNYFLVNLAVADLSMSTLNTSLNFVYMVFGNDWRFGTGFCKVAQFVCQLSIGANVFTFVAIACDRYVAIIHPLKPRMSAWVVLLVIVMIWHVSALISLPLAMYATTHTYVETNRTICYIEWGSDGAYGTVDTVYNVFLLLITYFIPLSALSVTYAKVGMKLWSSQAIGERTSYQEETIRSKRKVVKMMIVVVIIFALCWLPQHLYFIVLSLNTKLFEHPAIQHTYLIIYWLAMSNAVYNPILYCWMNIRFRSGFRYVFRWLPCIHWTPGDALGGPGRSGMGGGSLSLVMAGGKGGCYRQGSQSGVQMYRLTTFGAEYCSNGAGGAASKRVNHNNTSVMESYVEESVSIAQLARRN